MVRTRGHEGARGLMAASVVAPCVAGQIATAGVASAEAGDVTASECLTGDAGPRDLVAESDFGWFRTISL